MKQIRLKVAFSFDHCEIPAGAFIAVPAPVAQNLVMAGVAVYTEPERAVVAPQETRISQPHNRGLRRRTE